MHHTAGRSGILVYIALTERMVEVVADDGVVKSVEPTSWSKACAAIDGAVGNGGEATARALAALAPILALALPRHVEDLNELPDTIHEART